MTTNNKPDQKTAIPNWDTLKEIEMRSLAEDADEYPDSTRTNMCTNGLIPDLPPGSWKLSTFLGVNRGPKR